MNIEVVLVVALVVRQAVWAVLVCMALFGKRHRRRRAVRLLTVITWKR